MKRLILATLAIALLCCPAFADRPDDEIRINLRETNKLGVNVNTIFTVVAQLYTTGELDSGDPEGTSRRVFHEIMSVDPEGIREAIGDEDFPAFVNRLYGFIAKKMPVVLKFFN